MERSTSASKSEPEAWTDKKTKIRLLAEMGSDTDIKGLVDLVSTVTVASAQDVAILKSQLADLSGRCAHCKILKRSLRWEMEYEHDRSHWYPGFSNTYSMHLNLSKTVRCHAFVLLQHAPTMRRKQECS